MADSGLAEPGTRREAALRYRVGGMDCPSCAGKIEAAIGRLGGACDIRVNFQTQVLVFRLDEAATPREVVEERIRQLGYHVEAVVGPRIDPAQDASLEPNEVPPAWKKWVRDRKVRLALVLGVLLAVGFAGSVLAPILRHWAYLPAALTGLAFFGRQAIILTLAGSPFSIEMLMSIAAFGAILIGATAEAAAVVFLFTIGELLESIAAGRARAGIRALESLMPRTALLVQDGSARPVPAASLEIGDTVLIRPGDRVPADGEIAEGESELDESPITGESIPVARRQGDLVVAGSINFSGALQIRVTRTADDNTISRILRMVEEAQEAKAPTVRFIERFSRVYTPAAIGVTVVISILPPLVFDQPWVPWVYRGLALLLIACPCALVISTPAAIASGLAAGARRGLLVKSGGALETIGRVRIVAFDKTGTLTEGRPCVTDVFALSGTERSVLGLAAAVENGSSHPLGRAILEPAAIDNIPLRPAKLSRAVPGKAVEAMIAGKRVIVGSPAYAAEWAPLPAPVEQVTTQWSAQGKTAVVVSVDGAPVGLIAVRDEPRADAAHGIRALRTLNVRPVILSGDSSRTAAAIAAALGVEVKADLLPEDKLHEIAALKLRAAVAMVGDGINDTPALAAASVGIAMGAGTDVALETADAAILNSRVTDIAALVRLSRATLANVRQNVGVALGLKALFLVTTVAGITGSGPQSWRTRARRCSLP